MSLPFLSSIALSKTMLLYLSDTALAKLAKEHGKISYNTVMAKIREYECVFKTRIYKEESTGMATA